MNITDYINNMKLQRSNQIDTYTPIYQTAIANNIAAITANKNTIETYLFQTGTYLGIESLIDLYFNVCIALNTSGSMATLLTKTLIETWTSFDNPVYNPDGSIKVNTYISNNGLSLSGVSIFQSLIDLINIIIFNRTQPFLDPPYDTIPNPNYDVGYWDSNVTIYINSLITTLNNLITNYLTPINNFFTNLNNNTYIINTSIFTGFDSGRLTFYTNIQQFVLDLGGYLTTIISVATITTLNDFITYLTTDKTVCNNRINTISSSNTIFGLYSFSGTINNYRQLILASLVSFPDGIISILSLLSTQSTSTQSMITKQESLLTGMGIPTSQWIPLAQVISARFNQTKTNCSIVWIGNFHPNQYNVYRKLASLVTDNSQWDGSTQIATVTSLDVLTNWTIQNYTDTTIVSGQIYVYRILAIDNYWSSHGVSCSNSQSLQTDVYAAGAIINKCLSQ
jgi:hypothetical protein